MSSSATVASVAHSTLQMPADLTNIIQSYTGTPYLISIAEQSLTLTSLQSPYNSITPVPLPEEIGTYNIQCIAQLVDGTFVIGTSYRLFHVQFHLRKETCETKMIGEIPIPRIAPQNVTQIDNYRFEPTAIHAIDQQRFLVCSNELIHVFQLQSATGEAKNITYKVVHTFDFGQYLSGTIDTDTLTIIHVPSKTSSSNYIYILVRTKHGYFVLYSLNINSPDQKDVIDVVRLESDKDVRGVAVFIYDSEVHLVVCDGCQSAATSHYMLVRGAEFRYDSIRTFRFPRNLDGSMILSANTAAVNPNESIKPSFTYPLEKMFVHSLVGISTSSDEESKHQQPAEADRKQNYLLCGQADGHIVLYAKHGDGSILRVAENVLHDLTLTNVSSGLNLKLSQLIWKFGLTRDTPYRGIDYLFVLPPASQTMSGVIQFVYYASLPDKKSILTIAGIELSQLKGMEVSHSKQGKSTSASAVLRTIHSGIPIHWVGQMKVITL